MKQHGEKAGGIDSPRGALGSAFRRVLELVPVSGALLLPFGPSPTEAPGLLAHLRDGDLEPSRRRLAAALRALLRVPELPALFELPDRALRVEEALGGRAWLGSAVYQQHFRALSMASQLLVGFVDAAGAPRGLLLLGRTEGDAVIDERERALVLSARDDAERALPPVTPGLVPASSRPDDLLAVVTATLPVPTLVVTAGGRVLWMNDEAELRLGVVSVDAHRARFYAASDGALADLVARGLSDGEPLRHPREAGSAPRPPAWLLPGETLVARRHAGPEPRVLLCLHAPTDAPGREARAVVPHAKLGLSTREAAIATLAAEGYSVLAIAHRLGIAESTVSTHIKHVYRKLGVRSRAELASRVVRAH